MMLGKSNKAISRLLDVAEATVKHHVTAILKALKVTNRTEAVIAVGALGWQLPRVAELAGSRAIVGSAVLRAPCWFFKSWLTTERSVIGNTGLCSR